MRTGWLVPILAAATAACSVGDTKAAHDAVARFHQHYDQRQFGAIYDSAAEEFRRKDSRASFIRFVSALRERMGPVQVSARGPWRVNWGTGGTLVQLTYNTRFAGGAAQEQFVFRSGGGTAQLAGYHVSSRAFIEPPKRRAQIIVEEAAEANSTR